MALANLAVWSVSPDWSDGVLETLEWLTSILESPSGQDQRVCLRQSPRRSFEIDFKPVGFTRTLFDEFVLRMSGQEDIWLPVWHDIAKLSATVAEGSSLILLDTTFTEFRFSPAIFVQGPTPFEYEIYEISQVFNGSINTVLPMARSWPKGTRVYPLNKARIEQPPSVTKKADRAFQTRVKFSSTVPNITEYQVWPYSTYRGFVTLQLEPNDSQELSFEYGRYLDELDNQTGKRARFDRALGYSIKQYTWMARRRENHQHLRSMFYYLKGRLTPIWIPTFMADLDLLATITDDHMIVARCGFTDLGGPVVNRQDIAIQLYDGTWLFNRIVDCALLGDGKREELVLETELGLIVTRSMVKRISFMELSRLDQDAIEIQHHTDTKGVCTSSVVFHGFPADPSYQSEPDGGAGGSSDAVIYSMRVAVAGYTGPLATIRRSSDDETYDIEAVSPGTKNSRTDEGAFLDWLGDDQAFMVTWYDQGIHGLHMTAAAPEHQPVFDVVLGPFISAETQLTSFPDNVSADTFGSDSGATVFIRRKVSD